MYFFCKQSLINYFESLISRYKMKNYSKLNNVSNEYEDVYLENLESKEYFEYLLKYYKSWKKSSPSEFKGLPGFSIEISPPFLVAIIMSNPPKPK